uniref:Uncharacterized protein n=1 Tax=Acrobeloides nanus TaxID=290746 RepID=A0A914CHX0_9BILA
MSTPLYSPLFIYPPTKKRRAPRRGRPRAHPEPIDTLGTIIDVRRRPPKDAIGNGECISLPSSISLPSGSSSKDLAPSVMTSSTSHFEEGLSSHQIHAVNMQNEKNIMSKHDGMASQMAYDETIARSEDIPTEVEVDVEIEASDSMPRLRSRVARQIAEPPPQHPSHRAVVHYEQSMPLDFDPQTCNDIEILRHRLMEAYGELDELQHLPPTVQHLQNENDFLRETIASREDRIQQLEGILLERNMNLRQLLSENFLMSARLKRLQSEFGVDAVKDALKGLN